MAYIPVPKELPGIRGLFAYRAETAKPMSELVQVLLHDANTLSPGERELIATYVSSLNDCYYCQTIHGAVAAHHLGGDEELVCQVKQNFADAGISPKLKTLLAIAGKVQQGGKNVLPEDIDRAREQGATDREIHDTVLIAAAFCMYNRYVDGLATWAPADQDLYRKRGELLARQGYSATPPHDVPDPSGAGR